MITLKYDATCAETGQPLKKGEQAVYYPTSPKGKNLFHPVSKTADGYRTWKADQNMGYDY
jgi:Fe-S cluster biosynthesis and repair protein YggX